MYDFTPTESQELVVATARQFAARTLAPRAAELDAQGGFPRASLAEAASLGTG